MKNLISVALLIMSVSIALGQDNESTYDKLWSKVLLYNNLENNFLQKFLFTGRLQGDYHNFDNQSIGSEEDFNWRRFRMGFKANFFENFTFHTEADLNLEQPEPLYKNLTDTYISWSSEGGIKVKVGKQSAPFTLHGATSSKKLYTLERGKISSNIWFSREYYSGISLSGRKDNWEYLAGVYSSDHGAEFDEAFDYGKFGLISVGYNIKESLEFDNALIRIDIMAQEEDSNNATPDHKSVISLVAKFEEGKAHFWGDLSFSDGFSGQSDLWGFQMMPFYDLTDKTQAVFSYTHLKGSAGNPIKLTKYEKSLAGRGNEVDEYFLGLNHFFYGHKLKWQNGIQYTKMDSETGAQVYDGLGFTSGLRISW